ncbi:MAG: hypothetical protein MSA25_11390 [Clostridiales bacterium]|nr:hypothetical protein [Clostridiales bacterium]
MLITFIISVTPIILFFIMRNEQSRPALFKRELLAKNEEKTLPLPLGGCAAPMCINRNVAYTADNIIPRLSPLENTKLDLDAALGYITEQIGESK